MLGPDTVAVNDQLLAFPSHYAYNPQGFGPQTRGVPNITPSYPPFFGAATGTAPGAESVGGYGTAGGNGMAASIANAHPWNPRVSATPWVVGGLIASLLLLKAVHWRETILEGREGLDVGPAHESAEAGA